MKQKLSFIAVLVLIALTVVPHFSPLLSAQAATPTPEQLDQLLAPVALYPDALLSQITTASTNPQEILDVNAWLQQNPELTETALTDAAQQQGFDPAFIALVNFPQVLEMMAQHIDDYAEIGQAFLTDQAAVTASIQRLRAQAYDSGALQTTEQQKVEVQQAAGQTIYVIRPANPQIVYVPVYDPTVVYVRQAPGVVASASMMTFGPGIGISVLIVDNRPWGWSGWGWNWGAHRAYYNHGYWNGWTNPYRPPHRAYHPRPIVWANRPGYRGNWGYRPPQYRPPSRPVARPTPPPPGGNRPGRHVPPSANPDGPNRPVTPNPAKPAPDRSPRHPGQPAAPSQPDVDRPKPGQPRSGRPTTPGENKPARPGSPSTQPSKPEAPSRPDRDQPRQGRPTVPGGNRQARPDQPSKQPSQPNTPGQPESKPPQANRPDKSGRSQANARQGRSAPSTSQPSPQAEPHEDR
jgi:Protein of unknown function (DUF3300)